VEVKPHLNKEKNMGKGFWNLIVYLVIRHECECFMGNIHLAR